MCHPKRSPTTLFLSALLLVAAFAATTCTHPPGNRVPRSPECVFVPDPPENSPEDPFTADQDDDGLNEQQRLDFIRRGVAATIQIRSRRYSPAKGYSFHSGSGVFIDESHVLTAEHVVRDTVDRYALLRRLVSGGLNIGYLRTERITIVTTNAEHDVALLQIHCPAEMAYPLPTARDWIPQHDELLWQFGVRTGWSRGRVVRQVPDNLPVSTHGLVEMRILGQAGDSGGPVLNVRGEIVGLVLRGNTEAGRQFFVPINTALQAVGR